MRTLVIDQSTTTCGFAVVEDDPNIDVSFGVKGRLLQHGVIKTPAGAGIMDRLNIIRADLKSIINNPKYRPDEMVIENTNVKQRFASSQVLRAIFVLCQDLAKETRLDFYTQHIATIKKKVAGKGDANKDEMISAVMRIWGMSRYRILDDNHADALGAAYVWLYQGDEIREKTRKKRESRNARAVKSSALWGNVPPV